MKNRLTAAPVIKIKRCDMPSPAYTDFVKIFIASELNVSEENVAIRHEQAHIWCEHNRRYRKEWDQSVWMVACELEIARNIYNQSDIAVIKAPRSRLAGGYLPDSINDMPVELLYAEEIYDWLINNPDKQPKNQSMCSCACEEDGGNEQEIDGETVSGIVSRAVDSSEKLSAQKQAQEELSSKMASLKYKPPSLVDEMDFLLRYRINRERSWKRPSRREPAGDIIEKGHYSCPQRPLVEIFVDRSGSFCAKKTEKAESIMRNVLQKYNVQIQGDVFFFGSDRLSQTEINGGGNTPYHLIMKHIAKTVPKVAIVITDDDAAGPFTENKPKNTQIFCLPVGSSATRFASASGGKDVIFNFNN